MFESIKIFRIKIDWKCNLWVYYTIPFSLSLIWHFRAIIFNVWNYFVWLRMRIWSILLIKSDLKWCLHLSRSLLSYFNDLVSVTAGGPRSPRGHMQPSSTVDFGWFVVFESIKIFRIKIDWKCNLWVYYTIPFSLSLIWHFRAIIFNVWNHFAWLRITDEGSLPEMHIWSILLIKSDLKWCLHLSRSLFSYCNNHIILTFLLF